MTLRDIFALSIESQEVKVRTCIECGIKMAAAKGREYYIYPCGDENVVNSEYMNQIIAEYVNAGFDVEKTYMEDIEQYYIEFNWEGLIS